MNTPRLSRRRFLASTAATVAAPCIVPSTVFGQNAPSNRLTLGGIGVGGMGTTDVRTFMRRRDIQVLAVCDVDSDHRWNARTMVEDHYAEQKTSGTYRGCDDYNDFRDLVGRDDIDIVVIATPDHWHAIPAIAAANAGKHIYGEKPIGLTIADGRAIADAVARNGVVWQTGSWQRSTHHFIDMLKIVHSGAIGRLHTVRVGMYAGKAIGPQPEMPVPDGFDYDFWLGPAPWAPYTEKRCHGNFRFNLDYSGGKMLDFVPHHCDVAHWGMGTDYTGPVEVEGVGEFPEEGIWNGAVTFRVVCRYANGMTMIVADKDQERMGITFEGTDGAVFVGRYELDARPKSLLDEFPVRPIPIGEEYIRPVIYHIRDFVEAIRSGGRTLTPAEIAHRSASVGHLGNIAMLLRRKLRWDPDTEKFVGDEAANRMVSRAMRQPWSLA